MAALTSGDSQVGDGSGGGTPADDDSRRDPPHGERVMLPGRPGKQGRGSLAATMALIVLVGLESSGAYGVLAGLSPVSPFVLAVAAALAVAGATMLFRPVKPPLSVAFPLMLLVVADTISYFTSTIDPAITAQAVWQTVTVYIFTMVVLLLLLQARAWTLVAMAISVPMAVIGALSAANAFLLPGSTTFGGFVRLSAAPAEGTVFARYSGPLDDPNFWGQFLIIGLAFALALVAHSWSCAHLAEHPQPVPPWLLVSLAVANLSAIALAIYLSGSRGAFLAAAVTVVVFALANGVRARNLALWAMPSALLLLVPGIGSRLASILGLATAAQRAAVDGSVLERIAAQKVALAMIAGQPVTGVGPGGYAAAFPDYAAAAGVVVHRVVAPHNLYLGLWSEVGALGLLAWLLLIGMALVNCRSAIRMCGGHPRLTVVRMRPYVAATMAGLVGWSVAGFFLHANVSLRLVLILVALAGALRQTADDAFAAPIRLTATRTARRAVAIAVIAVGAVVGAGVPSFLPGTPTVQARAFLLPAVDNIYLINLRADTGVTPTYAEVIQSATNPQEVAVDSQGDVDRGWVVLTATARDRADAAASINTAVTQGDRALRRVGLTRLFKLEWQPQTSWIQPLGAKYRALGAAVGAGVALVLLLLARTGAGFARRRVLQRRGVK